MDNEIKQQVIERLQKGEELPPDWARLLFPPEKRECDLVYYGKEREEDILANTLAVPLQPVRTFGKNGGDDWHNMLIFGDNLQVMKSLLEMKKGGRLSNADGTPGIRLVYIDPPFASKQEFRGTEDQKAYQDKLTGAQFVEFVRKRLVLIKQLLADNGSLFIHLDWRKVHYLKAILDEIFGEQNFANEIIWRSTNTHNTKTSIGQIHQTILFYRKSKTSVFNPIRRPLYKGHVKGNYRYEDKRGKYSHCDITGPGIRTGDSGKAWRGYNPTASGRHWQTPSSIYDQVTDDISPLPMLERLEYLLKNGFIYMPLKGGQPRGKLYLNPKGGNLIQDIWAYQPYTSGIYADSDEGIDGDVQWLQNPEGGIEYPTQKPEGVLARIIRISTNPGDLVCDAFAGSGTTCAVAEKLSRRWVAIDCGKLAIYTIQKRMLNLRKNTGGTGPKFESKHFTLYNAGLYDFSKLKELSWESWRFFALQLFQCRDEPHGIGGVRFDGYLKGSSVLVFNHTINPGARFTEETLEEIHEAVGSRVGNKLFIIAPALTFGFQQDYIDMEGIRYYALRIPYSIINELHQREFSALKQPEDEMAVNDTVEAVGFDFIRTPELKFKCGVTRSKDELFKEGLIHIQVFKSEAVVREPLRRKGNLETLSMVMLDYDYDGEIFDLDALFYGDTLAKVNWEVRFPLESLGRKLMAVFIDIYGNEARIVLDVDDFGVDAGKKARKATVK